MELKRGSLLWLMLLASALPIRAQVAGLSTLAVLDMTTSARTAALGMDMLALDDNDLSLALDNPSLINARFDRRLQLNYVGLFGEARMGSVAYGFKAPHLGQLVVGLQFDGYGAMEGYDEYDQPTGTFYAADYMFFVGWGMQIDSAFAIGASLKPVYSHYDCYSAFALAADVSGSYRSPDRRFNASLLARNIGTQVLTFDGTVENIPFSLDAAFSYKLANAPFRFYLQTADLHRWNLTYEDDLNPDHTTDPFTGEETYPSSVVTFLDNLARHAIIGVELGVRGVFFARVGYNYRQMREMQYVDRQSLNFSGFSYGFGIHAKRFDFSFARNNYHLGQAPNYLSLNFHL